MNFNKVLISALCFCLAIALGSSSAIATPADGVVLGVTKIVDNGPASDRYNLVLIAEGYQETEQNQFSTDAQAFVDFFFATPPFLTNYNSFNIWLIEVASDDSGADDPTACGGTGVEVDTYFDASFCGDGAIRRLLVANDAIAIDVLNAQVPEWDQGLIIVNSNIYGGSGGSIGVTSVSGTWQNVAIHEFGHAAFGLADEYESWAGCGIDTDRDHHPAVEPAQPNVTIETDRTLVKWGDLILDTTPVPTTQNADCTQCDPQGNPYPDQTMAGLYEGAHYYHCDSFRPAFNCMMRNFEPFCPVCTRRILEVLEPFGLRLRVDSVSPLFGMAGQDLQVTLTGTGFNENTRVSIAPDVTNKKDIIASVDTPGEAYGVAITGDNAYVVDGDSGLQIIDISNPSNPTIIGSVDTPGSAYGVAITEDKAYVADSTSLQIIDISDPSNPTIIASVDTSDWANGVAIAEDKAYVVDGDGGLQIIDISDPSNPFIIGSVDTPYWANGVAITGDKAYVADGSRGLLILPLPIEILPVTVSNNTSISFTIPAPPIAGNYILRVFNANESDEAFITFISDADTDDDGISDGTEDVNKNGIVDPGETDPCSIDTDGDGIQDGTELGITDPVPDPDGDGPLLGTDTSIFIPDADSNTTTNPLNADSDGDGAWDGVEDANQNGAIDLGETDPSNPSSYTAQTTIHLKKGFNLIAIPSDVTNQPDLKDWLPVVLGNSSEIEKVMTYDGDAGKFTTLIPGDTSNPSFILNGGEGLIVYAKKDKDVIFTSVLCATLDFKQGFNLIGFACPKENYTAFQLLNDLGSENVSSIQRYVPDKGAFETAGFDPNGQPAGVDFPIVRGEGYFVFMKQGVLDFRF